MIKCHKLAVSFVPWLCLYVPQHHHELNSQKGLLKAFIILQACRNQGYPHILSDQLTLTHTKGESYAHHIATGPSKFLDLPTALILLQSFISIHDSKRTQKENFQMLMDCGLVSQREEPLENSR